METIQKTATQLLNESDREIQDMKKVMVEVIQYLELQRRYHKSARTHSFDPKARLQLLQQCIYKEDYLTKRITEILSGARQQELFT